jgi:hypothetical protein
MTTQEAQAILEIELAKLWVEVQAAGISFGDFTTAALRALNTVCACEGSGGAKGFVATAN